MNLSNFSVGSRTEIPDIEVRKKYYRAKVCQVFTFWEFNEEHFSISVNFKFELNLGKIKLNVEAFEENCGKGPMTIR